MKQSSLYTITSSTLNTPNTQSEYTTGGYAFIINTYKLPVPLPESILIFTNEKHFSDSNHSKRILLNKKPSIHLHENLTLALTYEGINLLVLKKLFEVLTLDTLIRTISTNKKGSLSRKLWFLYEWLMQKKLPIEDLPSNSALPLVDASLQFCINGGEESKRHGIINNLPGTPQFCPLIRKTPFLLSCITSNMSDQKSAIFKDVSKKILERSSSYLLLKDTVASFTIEGEHGKDKRAQKWAEIIGQAGEHVLSLDEFERLQKTVIENDRFITMGYRSQNGYIGSREPNTFKPIPDHFSAKHEDVRSLLKGLLICYKKMLFHNINPVLIASVIAFGFVFIHPFEDGNGRIHRYLIHHIFAKTGFAKHNVVFPISASMLTHIDEYRYVLEAYSRPLLQFIKWNETDIHNVNILNETADYYRYFDATAQAEFLYKCVKDTITHIIPDEINYLTRYEAFKNYIQKMYNMPEQMIRLLVIFLEQNNGKLSKRALKKEFSELKANEVEDIEKQYAKFFRWHCQKE